MSDAFSADFSLDYEGIGRFLRDVDNLPGLMDEHLGAYCTWPIVKPVVNGLLMNSLLGREGPRAAMVTGDDSPARPGLVERLANRGRFWRDVADSRLRQARLSLADTGGRMVIMRLRRRVESPDGCLRDSFFDDLVENERFGLPLLLMEYSGRDRVGRAPQRANALPLEPLYRLARLRARKLAARDGAMRAAGARIHARLVQGAEWPVELAPELLVRELARFEAYRRLFRNVLRRTGARCLMLLDSDMRLGEIAAARELGMPVIELQHGNVGPLDPGLGWPGSVAAHKPRMPIPDLILVYGELWREILLGNGFWSERETAVVGSAQIDRYRTVAPAGREAPPGSALIILCTTCTPGLEHLIGFWDRFLSLARGKLEGRYEVRFKVHPAESHTLASYERLRARYPRVCRIVPTHENTMKHMLAADVVASTFSTTQLEAVGLGVPAVAICGGPVRSGPAGILGKPDLADAIYHTDSPLALLEFLGERLPGSTGMSEWRHRTAGFGNRLFASGFLENATATVQSRLRERAMN